MKVRKYCFVSFRLVNDILECRDDIRQRGEVCHKVRFDAICLKRSLLQTVPVRDPSIIPLVPTDVLRNLMSAFLLTIAITFTKRTLL